MSSPIEVLFAEVYANPDDDQVRRVLADALLAAGDPRGELILFQLEPARDYQRRAMRLIQQHGLSWLGPLRGVVIPLAYERGFLASCAMLAPNPQPCAEWATVHSIEVERVAFTLHPEMRSLRRLRVAASMLEELAIRSRPLLAAVTVHVAYDNEIEGVVARQAALGLGRVLVIEDVPEQRYYALRAHASPTHIELRVSATLVVAGPEAYDDVDE